jgi:hyaluronoglucosaminidase
MSSGKTFQRRGIVEGFFGPLWSMAHRKAIFKFGAKRGVNTYLYAPKDDVYHRQRWTEPYPRAQWRMLSHLVEDARRHRIDFVYGFHPGKGLGFSSDKPVSILLRKAQRFFDAGVRTFAVLFDDIPSLLEQAGDRKQFNGSLARAEGTWLQMIQARQPASWKHVEWWICPSYYTPDPLLARWFGAFEEHFLEKLAESLPPNVACFWTGPRVVPQRITVAHVKQIAGRIQRPLILWDNYPVNDLSMSDELHIGPLKGRDPRLPDHVYGYLNNPLLQEELSFVPLATCFDYAARPMAYDAERSWERAVRERYGGDSIAHWRAIRLFCDKSLRAKTTKRELRLSRTERAALQAACGYLRRKQDEGWAREMQPWKDRIERVLETEIQKPESEK